MIQAVLDNIKEVSASIGILYTNRSLNAKLTGSGKVQELSDNSMRAIYLWGVINYTYLVDEVPYIGGTAVTDAMILEASQKLYHYNSQSDIVDLSDYSEIVPDDGDGGVVVETPTPETSDHYRSGSMSVVIGANPVTFLVGGVPTPFTSNDYTVQAWVISNSGFRQNNLVIVSQVASGFTANDILEGGTLHYIATLNT
jgi:hypothetical protein